VTSGHSAAVPEPLDATRVRHPVAGEVVSVDEGTVFAFALCADGRRIEVQTLERGQVLVGCEPTPNGTRLLISGAPGTKVTVGSLDDRVPESSLRRWALALGRYLADGRWPQRVLGPDDVSEVLAPGECVSITGSTSRDPDAGTGADADVVGWLTVTSGSALVCGAPEATVGPLDPPLPVGRGMWLSAGLRCWMKVADAPASSSHWRAPLDALGRATLDAAVARQRARDRAAVARLNPRRRASRDATVASVELVASAAGHDSSHHRTPTSTTTAELEAAVLVARASGLVPPVDVVDRVNKELESGRSVVDAAAAVCGATARRVTLGRDRKLRQGRPMIAWIREDASSGRKPVMLEHRRRWSVVDPVTGERTPLYHAVRTRLEPVAVELVPVLPNRPVRLDDLRRLATRGTRGEAAWVAALSLAIAAAAFAAPVIIGRVAASLLVSSDHATYIAAFSALALAIVAGSCWSAVRSLCLLRLRAHAVSVAAGSLWDRTMRQSARWHSQHEFGVRHAQATAVATASNAFPDDAVARCLDIGVVVGSLAAVATTSVPLVTALVAATAFQLVALARLLRSARKRADRRNGASAAATGRLQETLRGVAQLRVAGAESRALLRWAQPYADFTAADRALRVVRVTQGLVIAMWPTFAYVLIVVVAEIADVGLGDFVLAQVAVAAVGNAIAAAASGGDAAVVAQSALAMASPTLESVPEGGSGALAPGTLHGAISVRDVTFRYAAHLPQVLDGISIDVSPGEHVAIVGPSGCGKTTLMRLVLGLESPDSGTVMIDGRNLAELDQPATRRQIGPVLQSSALLPSTIRRNVDMGRGLRSSVIWTALDAAGIGDEVRRMPMGLDTPVSDGAGNISGGQRQRILIARAMANQPRVLIFDEATSALDNITQANVIESLDRLRITRLVVAHRLSTVRNADRIIVMNAGHVVDQGTFPELMARDGVFREMALRQQV